MKSLARFFEISQKLIPPFVVYSLTRNNLNSKRFQNSLVGIRVAMQELGPMFIKLGQLLSARPDLVGPELSSELRNLLDNEPPLPISTVREIVETELKKDISQLFSSFEQRPISTASIGQVHSAVLKEGGKKVAVKVQKPHLVEIIKKDLTLFKYFAYTADKIITRKGLQFSYIYEEFSEWINNELDFEIEGRRADKFRDNMEGIEGIVIPLVYWEHTTPRVLVLSYIVGITLNDILDLTKKQQAATVSSARLPFSVDPDTVIQHVTRAMVKQMFVDKFFHGDLHPANMIVQKKNEVGFIDFGIVGTLDNEEHTKLLFILLALIDNDTQSLMKVVVASATDTISETQKKQMYQQFSRELHQLHEDAMGKVSLSHFINLFLSVTHRYDVVWSSGLMLAAKTISQIDSVAKEMGSKTSVVDLLKPEIESYMLHAFSSGMSKELMYKSVLQMIQSGRKIPDTLSEVKEFIKTGTTVRLENSEMQKHRPSLVFILFLMIISVLIAIPILTLPFFSQSPYQVFFSLLLPVVLYFILSKIFAK